MVSRAEHRRSTLLRLSAATTEAFEQLGSAATMDDIAERAGVSRRTIFRYVDSKEELAYIHPILWLEIFDEAVAEVAGEPAVTRLLHAADRISRHVGDDPDPVKRAMAVAIADPRLRGRVAANQRWVARLADEILEGDPDPQATFRARVLGSAVMGVIDAALAQWFTSPPEVALVDLVSLGLDYLTPIFD